MGVARGTASAFTFEARALKENRQRDGVGGTAHNRCAKSGVPTFQIWEQMICSLGSLYGGQYHTDPILTILRCFLPGRLDAVVEDYVLDPLGKR